MFMKIAAPQNFDMNALVNELNSTGKSFNITAEISDYS